MTNEVEELSVRDLAERFGRDQSTIRRWRQRGRLPAPIVDAGLRGARWDARTISAWESEGFATADPGEFLAGMAADLGLVSSSDEVREPIRKLAGLGADLLRTEGISAAIRLAMASVFLGVDWFKESLSDLDALQVGRARLRIIGMLNEAKRGADHGA